MFKAKTLKSAALVLGLIIFSMGLGVYTAHYYTRPQPAADIQGLFWPNPKQIQNFTTVDHTGEEFGLERLKGRWSFLFFGYTHCPDICPITLSVMDRVERQLEQRGITDTRTLFVTVDPERDHRQQLAEYVAYFNPEFIGLGGSEDQIQSLTRQIGVVAARGEPSAEGDYLVDHSASLFLVDPQGRLVSLFSAPHQADDIVARFLKIRRFLERQA